MSVADFWFEAEDLFFDFELEDFEPLAPVSAESAVAACNPAPTAPVTAPPTAPVAAPLIISLNVSVAALTKPLPELEVFLPPLLFWLEPLLLFLAGAAFFAGADLAVDFEPEFAVLPDVVDFEPEPVDLLAVDLEAEPDDFPAEVFVPVDLLAEVFDADEPEEDLAAPDLAAGFADDLLAVVLEPVFGEPLAEVDFAPVFEPEDLLVEAARVGAAFLVDDEAAFGVADFLFVVVDFVELVAGFLVGIFFSLKCFRTNFTKTGLKQTHERIFTRIDCACQDIF